MPLAAGMYYARFDGGAKKPVVLIHGAGGSHLCWPASMRRLSGRTVLALDLPGHGRSEGVALQSVDAMTAAVLSFLAEIGLYHAVFVGHSLGGAVALQLAMDYPQHTAGIGLISSGASFDVSMDLLHYLSSTSTHESALKHIQINSFAAAASPALIRHGMEAIKTVRPSVLYADWLACANFDLRKRLGEIQTPAYIACGLEDRLAPPPLSRFLAAELPAARLNLIPGAGHMLPVEQPEPLANGLRQYLSELDQFAENIPVNWSIRRNVGNGQNGKAEQRR